MKVLAPTNHPDASTSVDWFLAGGISGCPDWQSDVVSALADNGLVLANPRRQGSIDMVGSIGTEQITWEHRMLSQARGLLFWFPSETLCPITLYELGAHHRRYPDVRLAVGVHPGYARGFDVRTQLALSGVGIPIAHSVGELIQQVREDSL